MSSGPFTVSVPATSANLGPGFDSLGLALGLRDEVTAEITDSGGVVVQMQGQGADELPRDETHLIAATLLQALRDAGVDVSGLQVSTVNRIPHGRGLGSSAAAVVAAVTLARCLSGGDDSPISLDRQFDLAVAIEGHPDNVAPAILGGLTIAWPDVATGKPRAVPLKVHPSVRAIVCVPNEQMSTQAARGLLPAQVSHSDASATAARSALLVHALTSDPSLLLDATADLLHQPYRLDSMPHSRDLIATLRGRGVAATLSGSGPTVLVLTTEDDTEAALSAAPGFEVWPLEIEARGAYLLS